MKLIIGLGNPGEKYQNTRHNLGFMALDQLLEKYERVDKTFWEKETKFRAEVKKLDRNGATLLLAKPTTFMNLSGEAVSKIVNYYKIPLEDIIVIYDDLDIPFGKIRIRFGGGAGGHHGVESIIEHVGDKFLRMRLGIGTNKRGEETKSRNHENVDEYVLGEIGNGEKGKIKSMLKEAEKSVSLILENGIETYMSKYNK